MNCSSKQWRTHLQQDLLHIHVHTYTHTHNFWSYKQWPFFLIKAEWPFQGLWAQSKGFLTGCYAMQGYSEGYQGKRCLWWPPLGHISAGSHIVPTVVPWERSKNLLLFLHNLALPDLQAQTSPTGTHREVSSPHVAAALLKFDLHPLKTPKASSAVQSILYSQPESVMEFYLLLCNPTLFSSTLMFLMCASGILTLLMFLLCGATSSAVWKPWDY